MTILPPMHLHFQVIIFLHNFVPAQALVDLIHYELCQSAPSGDTGYTRGIAMAESSVATARADAAAPSVSSLHDTVAASQTALYLPGQVHASAAACPCSHAFECMIQGTLTAC
jgi:hypothetical protein